MYAPGEDSEDFPLHLTTDMVTLTHTSIESSIIATTQWGEDDGEWEGLGACGRDWEHVGGAGNIMWEGLGACGRG